jgi:integrase
LRNHLSQKHQRYTRNYVKALLRTLHTIFSQAMEEEIIDRNPAARLGKYLSEKHVNPERAINPFTSAELASYLQAMQTHYPQHYAYFLCLARTGMREGEALGLSWDDVQLGTGPNDPHRFLHVRRTYDPVHHTFNTPKTGQSRRVDMSQELRAVLLDLRHQRFDEAVLRGSTTVPQIVFCGRQGTPLLPSNLYRIHRRVCGLAGLRATRGHDLRHSYATIQLYEHHAPIQYVSEQLGHASIKITVDTYGHPRQGTSIVLADQLDAAAVAPRPLPVATVAQPQYAAEPSSSLTMD